MLGEGQGDSRSLVRVKEALLWGTTKEANEIGRKPIVESRDTAASHSSVDTSLLLLLSLSLPHSKTGGGLEETGT